MLEEEGVLVRWIGEGEEEVRRAYGRRTVCSTREEEEHDRRRYARSAL
jgi:hypothetical protein